MDFEVDLDEEKDFTMVMRWKVDTPVKKNQIITPVKKSRNNFGKNRRKKTKIIKLNKQEGEFYWCSPSSGGTNTKIVEIGNSSEKTFIRFNES